MMMIDKKHVLIAAVLVLVVLQLWTPVQAQALAQFLGNTTAVQNRAFLPPLSADDTTHHLLYKNEKNQRYFLRLAIQRPKFRHAFFLVVRNDAKIKSVEVVAKAITRKQKSVGFAFRPAGFYQGPQNPFRMYTVTWEELGDVYNRKSADDSVIVYDWISFDLELDFPASATPDEQRRFLYSRPGQVRLMGLDYQDINEVPASEDQNFYNSIYQLIPN